MAKVRQYALDERPVRQYRATDGRLITREEVERFLTNYETLDRAEGTFQFYRRKMRKFYEDLPEDKIVRHGTLEKWQKKLLQDGYAPSTVNSFLSAANVFMEYIGHREYQLEGQLHEENKAPVPELSRAEYLHLLQTAKILGNEKVYLMIKTFATTGILVQDLHELTIEAIHEGRIICGRNQNRQILTIPKCLQKELLSFANKKGIRSGPVFITRNGRPISRTNICAMTKKVCEAARLTDERGTPRGLRKLYQSTRAAIESNVALLVEQAMERQLEQEQFSIGWEEV